MTHRHNNYPSKRRRERHISVRAVRREQVDIGKLSRALIALAQAEAAAQAEHQADHEAERGRQQPADTHEAENGQ